MSSDGQSKVQARHLKRSAFLYVRQSSLRQVFENSESTKRQYDLRQRAISLGWRVDQVVIIDSDQGQSGKSSADREGFQRLVTEVSLGRVGIVMGLEVSRLARNSPRIPTTRQIGWRRRNRCRSPICFAADAA